MSDDFGSHHFLAWARQGLVATLTNPDYGTTPPTGAPSPLL